VSLFVKKKKTFPLTIPLATIENANPPHYQPHNSPTPNDILMFKQHKDEPIYDAWTRFKNLLRKVPHHSFDLWSQIEIFYHRVDHYTKMDIDHAADGDLWGLSADKAWETIENCALLAKKNGQPNKRCYRSIDRKFDGTSKKFVWG
jgi:hypothetical protein